MRNSLKKAKRRCYKFDGHELIYYRYIPYNNSQIFKNGFVMWKCKSCKTRLIAVGFEPGHKKRVFDVYATTDYATTNIRGLTCMEIRIAQIMEE